MAGREYGPAISHARRLLTIEPWHEITHQQLMRMLARQGKFSEALAQYRRCEAVLARELNVASPAGDGGAARADSDLRATARHNSLPPQHTPFVGRQQELEELGARLHDPACRLLTIAGLGGVGKTRLALKLAENHASFFLSGVCYVDLNTSFEGRAALATSIVEALALPGNTTETQLLDYLSEQELLLVLDNMDHLIDDTALVADIVHSAPDVSVLVTSRERLNLGAEWLYVVRGLAYPARNQAMAAGEPEASDAVLLFLQNARRIRPDYAPDSLEPIVQICQVVEGMPLAIELAAGWVQSIPTSEILWDIERGLEVLSTSLRRVDERHQSLNVVFEHSWRLLSPEQQRTLSQFSVFNGGCTAEAAYRVTQADRRTLASLVNKSLLQIGVGDRLNMHQLLQQFAAAKLNQQPEQKSAVVRRHAEYYACYLRQSGQALRAGERHAEALAALTQDDGNLSLAWKSLVQQGDLDEILDTVEALYLYYEHRGAFLVAVDSFETTASTLAASDDAGARSQLVHATLLARAGWFYWRLNQFDVARSRLQSSLNLLARLDDGEEHVFVLDALGLVAESLGEYGVAQDLHRQSLHVCRANGNRLREGRILNELGVIARVLAHHAEALQMHQEALTISEELHDWWGKATALNNLGLVAQRTGDYARAESLYKQGLAIRHTSDDAWGIAVSQITLADLYCDLGRLSEAASLLEESDLICRETGGPWGRAYWLLIRGVLTRLCGDPSQAEELHRQSLGLWRTMGAQSKIARTLNHLGNDLILLGNPVEAEHAFSESDDISRRIGYRSGRVSALAGLGDAATLDGSYRSARLHLDRALSLAEDIQEKPLECAVSCSYAILLERMGRREQAGALIQSILDATATLFETRTRLKQMCVARGVGTDSGER